MRHSTLREGGYAHLDLGDRGMLGDRDGVTVVVAVVMPVTVSADRVTIISARNQNIS